MYYKDDRKYTDAAHLSIAVPLIYDPLGWKTYPATEKEDICYEIDYRGTDDQGTDILIQERFRRASSAKDYGDFTLRYQRPGGLSEYYKMQNTIASFSEPYYMVYGTIGDRLDKYAVIDLRDFFAAIDKGLIVVGQNNSIRSKISDNKLFSGLGFNRDGSSSFVSFGVRQLVSVVPGCIIRAEGW